MMAYIHPHVPDNKHFDRWSRWTIQQMMLLLLLLELLWLQLPISGAALALV